MWFYSGRGGLRAAPLQKSWGNLGWLILLPSVLINKAFATLGGGEGEEEGLGLTMLPYVGGGAGMRWVAVEHYRRHWPLWSFSSIQCGAYSSDFGRVPHLTVQPGSMGMPLWIL